MYILLLSMDVVKHTHLLPYLSILKVYEKYCIRRVYFCDSYLYVGLFILGYPHQPTCYETRYA